MTLLDVPVEPLQLQLLLEQGGDPIRGRLVRQTGQIVTFAGWLELIAAIETSRDSNGPGRADVLNETSSGQTLS